MIHRENGDHDDDHGDHCDDHGGPSDVRGDHDDDCRSDEVGARDGCASKKGLTSVQSWLCSAR